MRHKMSLEAKKELLRALRPTYADAETTAKTALLDGFIAGTGYSRKHAISLLSGLERSTVRKPRVRVYDDALKESLIKVWCAANKIASKRFIPFLPELLESLERCGHLKVTPVVRVRFLVEATRIVKASTPVTFQSSDPDPITAVHRLMY
jgi:hypothetical protein